ncbi:EpsG-like putative glucosyltransferase [Acinetobacter calcoaceticus]|uniref:EpsG-like putative glucosyltransferase n=1 Tax=Acinetobacter calcoaceticus TaxID=471 RepID=A0A4R1XJ17_ACICA|nr:EpsG-like putative glucosyltransferase [Acinetobacter calcoaceticus]
MQKSIYEKSIYYLFASLISILYVGFIVSLPNEWFRDRNYYVIYANEAERIIENSSSILGLLLNEPIFLRVAQFFGNYISAELFPVVMSGFVAAVYTFSLIKYSRTFIMFTLGLLSLVFISYLQTAQVMVLRQGVATAIFLLIFLSSASDKRKIIFCALLSLFHSVFFIVTAVYAAYMFFLREKDTKLMLVIVAIAGAVLFLLSSFLLTYLGFRQADLYANTTENSGGGAFILSLFTFIYLYFFGSKENKALYDWTLIGLVLFLVGYFLFFSAGRLFVTFFPFVLILLVSKSRLQDILFLIFINIIYIYLFYTGEYMILFDYAGQPYVTNLFEQHINRLLNYF